MTKRWAAFVFACLALLAPAAAQSREPLWRFITGGRIRSFPAIGRDGNVYLLSDDRFLYSLSPAGEQRWRYYLEERLTDSFAIGYDGMIHIGYKTGELIAVHGYGRKVWQYDTGEKIVLAPAVRTDGTVCLVTDQGTLFAVSHTGALLWKLKLPGNPSSSPVADIDNALYVTLTDGSLVAVHPWGEINWRLRLTGAPTYPAIGADGTLYVGTRTGAFYAIDPLPKILWRRSHRGSILPAVIGASGVVYFATSAGELAAVAGDGDSIWSLPLGAVPSGPCVIGEAGTIFIATMNGTLFAIDPAGRIVWDVRARGVLTQLMLSPQGILFAGSSDWAVYAFPAEALARAPWPAFRHDVSHTGASTRPWDNPAIEQRYGAEPDFVYFRSLFASRDTDLMLKGLSEIRELAETKALKDQRPYLLHFLRGLAGFTVIEEDKTIRFPLRGFSPVREEACRLYTDIGGLESYPLLLRILKQDKDMTMKTVAVRGLGRLGSNRDQEAVRAISRLILAPPDNAVDDSFAREAVIALEGIAKYQGTLPGEGVQALLALSTAAGTAEVRGLAREALRRLGQGR